MPVGPPPGSRSLAKLSNTTRVPSGVMAGANDGPSPLVRPEAATDTNVVVPGVRAPTYAAEWAPWPGARMVVPPTRLVASDVNTIREPSALARGRGSSRSWVRSDDPT